MERDILKGISSLNLDNKGRLAIPRRYHAHLTEKNGIALVLTLSPYERSLFLYAVIEWALIETKLSELSDSDRQVRQTKQMMLGYASGCQLDAQGRILIPKELRDYAELEKSVVVLGQGKKLQLWDERNWAQQKEQWLGSVGKGDGEAAEALKSLAL